MRSFVKRNMLRSPGKKPHVCKIHLFVPLITQSFFFILNLEAILLARKIYSVLSKTQYSNIGMHLIPFSDQFYVSDEVIAFNTLLLLVLYCFQYFVDFQYCVAFSTALRLSELKSVRQKTLYSVKIQIDDIRNDKSDIYK